MDGQENNEVRFVVYGEPVSKARPRFSGHAYTPEKTRIQEEKIALVYKSKYHTAKFEKDIPLRVEADFYLKIPQSAKKQKDLMIEKEILPIKRPDVDNLLKTVCDAVLKIAYEDDSQIVELIGRKYWSDNPRTEILIERAVHG